uniref:Uncharacterized protein n=1 Tax=Hucho hucho TaxID=62062 RepID=A0A4W5K1Y5_9TELE
MSKPLATKVSTVRVTLRHQSGGGSQSLCDPALLLLHHESPKLFDHGQVIENPSLTGKVGFACIPAKKSLLYIAFVQCLKLLRLGLSAPPSLPLCLWDGVTDIGGSVALSCMVAEGVPTPEITVWYCESLGVLLTRSMALVLRLHRSGQQRKWRGRKRSDNEVRYTPSLIKHSFV